MRHARSLLIGGSLVLAVTAAAAQAPHQPSKTAPVPRPVAAVSLPRGNLEHGRYIVEHVAMCIECHSGRDSQGNISQSQLFLGAPIPFAPPWPNDWAMRAPRNKGLPGYDDGLALRLLTQGAIGRNGEQLRPPMPRFRMTVEDAADVIAYLRSMDGR
jgi:mono/diheme cytochrome c family protein